MEITHGSSGASGSGVSSLSVAGDVELTGDVTLSEGANILLTQVGQDIQIESTPSWDSPFGTASFTYDVDGNVETKTVGLTVLTFTYDVDGNVDTITDGSNTKTFAYDVGGNVETITYS
jgi:uncharacterized protein RhaS with RHS repeats